MGDGDNSADWCAVGLQVYEVNRKLLQEHAAPLMAVYLHGVAVVRQELSMDVGRKSITGLHPFGLSPVIQCVHPMSVSGIQSSIKTSLSQVCVPLAFGMPSDEFITCVLLAFKMTSQGVHHIHDQGLLMMLKCCMCVCMQSWGCKCGCQCAGCWASKSDNTSTLCVPVSSGQLKQICVPRFAALS